MFTPILAFYTFANDKLLGLYIYFAQANPCQNAPNFFQFPTWHKYLEHRAIKVGITGKQECSPHLSGITDVWLIGLAVVEIILRIAVIAAIIYVMIGGMKYVNARGNAEKTESAKKTVIDALIGLVIAVTATAIISYIGGSFGG